MNKRYVSLDVLRGLTITLMCIVNNPGTWGKIFPPLRHAGWEGCTPTDLVFPFFVFCAGCAMAFSLRKYEDAGAKAYLHVLKRGALIFLAGVLLALYPFFPVSPHDETASFWQNFGWWLGHKRVFGVLQRIGMAYAIAGCLVLWLRKPGRVLTAVGQVMSSVTFDVVTEAPQKLPDASVVIHVPLKKADLTVLMESIAKVLWSMPVVQQMAPSVTLSSGAPLTEETLTAALKDIPNVLAEDAMLRIYANQNMDRIYLTFEAVIESETPASLSADMLVTVQETGLTASWSMNALQNQAGMLMSGEATLTANHLDYTVSADMQQGEQTWRAVDNVLSADFTLEETSRTVNVTMNARGKSAPAADVVGLIVTGRMQDQDLGDHAESSAEFTFTLENMGDLFTLRLQETTGMAEAYICNPDIAIRPAAMSPEEQTALVDTLRANLQQAVVTSMQKLPASTLRLIMNQFMQNAQ